MCTGDVQAFLYAMRSLLSNRLVWALNLDKISERDYENNTKIQTKDKIRSRGTNKKTRKLLYRFNFYCSESVWENIKIIFHSRSRLENLLSLQPGRGNLGRRVSYGE